MTLFLHQLRGEQRLYRRSRELAIFTFLFHFDDAFDRYYAIVAFSVVLRAAALTWILGSLVRGALRETRKPSPLRPLGRPESGPAP